MMEQTVDNWIGLVDVVGGKMWYLWDNKSKDSRYYHLKKECEEAVKQIYADNKEIRHKLLVKLYETRGKAYILK